jgi:hypothetical protein
MAEDSLSDYAGKILKKGRISFGDVQRLQRDVLPDGIRSREEAELLLDLDRRVEKSDAAWGRCLAVIIVDFVVWGERPTGVVDEDTACWLSATLAGQDGLAGKRARLIVREIVEEAQAFENDALLAIADLGRASHNSRRAEATALLNAEA